MKLFRKGSVGQTEPASIYEKKNDTRWGFALTKNAAIYGAVLVAALIFTQALRSTLSNIFFVFVVLLPIVMGIYLLLARATLSVYRVSTSSTVEKNKPYTYQFKLSNSGIFPYPFIESFMLLPQEDMVRTTERCVWLSMPPLSTYDVNNTVSFHYRGTYEVGVKSFYVYDLFRMFRMRIRFEDYDTVYVVPRCLYIRDSRTRATADESDTMKKVGFSYDRVEISDIRDYRSGDSLKSIHWKLSSKSEEFVVRDYDSGTSRRTFIFADMSARFPETLPKDEDEASGGKPAASDYSELAQKEYYSDMNEYCADGVCELTVATVLRELRNGNTCSLFWFDSRTEGGACGYTIRGMEDFAIVFRLFATAPLSPKKSTLRRLTSMVKDTQNIKLLFVSSAIDPEAMAEYSTIAETSEIASGSAEVILYNPYERFLYPHERKIYFESCREELSSHGLRLTEGKLETTLS